MACSPSSSKAEAGGESWKQTVIAVRDQYAKLGLTEAQALADVAALWEASKNGPEAAAAAVAKIQANLDKVAEAEKNAAAAEATASTARSAHVEEMTKILDGLTSKREQLFQSIANEAPEEVMGVVEAGVRGQLAVLDDQIAYQRGQLEMEAQAAANNLEDALGGIHPDAIHVPVVFDIPRMSLEQPEVFDAIPMADGGIGRVTGPTLFYSAGNEDFAFSGEGRRFGGGGGGDTVVHTHIMIDGRQVAESVERVSGNSLRDRYRLRAA